MIYTFATRARSSARRHPRPQSARGQHKDGSIRNGYTVRIINKRLQQREFALGVAGPPGIRLEAVGATPRADGRTVICGRA